MDDENSKNVQVVLRDVTDRLIAEDKLKISEELHREAQEVAHIGHWELDPKVGKPVWSDEIFRIFDLEPGQGEPSFTNHETHLHPDDWPGLNEAVTRGSLDGTPFDLTFRIVRPSGEIRWMHAIGKAEKDKNNEVKRLLGLLRTLLKLKMQKRRPGKMKYC